MNAEELRAKQAPFKEKYKESADSAKQTLRAECVLDVDRVVCKLAPVDGPMEAGLHPSTGGDGKSLCSAEMLLQSLVGCAGVTLGAVSTALAIPIRGGSIIAEGDIDFRGTLGVDKTAPVGLTKIRLEFNLDSDAPRESIDKLINLVEHYCVVYQTLKNPPQVETSVRTQ